MHHKGLHDAPYTLTTSCQTSCGRDLGAFESLRPLHSIPYLISLETTSSCTDGSISSISSRGFGIHPSRYILTMCYHVYTK